MSQCIEKSKGEIILQTDADCIFNSDWIQKMVFSFINPSIGFIAGPDPIRYKNPFFYKFAVMDSLSIDAFSASTLKHGVSLSCVGRNISFRKYAFFEIGGYDVDDKISGLNKSIGLTLLEPHINYTNYVFSVIDAGIKINGIAHITGGGMLENIPRILPNNCGVEISEGSWPTLPVFNVMQTIGDIDQEEMIRAFNMGIGMVFIVDEKDANDVKNALKDLTDVYNIGSVVFGKGVHIV